MTRFPSTDLALENKLVGNILRQYPQMSKVVERYFGGHCLKRPGFKIQTLGIACILFDVDRNRLIQDLKKVQSEDEDG